MGIASVCIHIHRVGLVASQIEHVEGVHSWLRRRHLLDWSLGLHLRLHLGLGLVYIVWPLGGHHADWILAVYWARLRLRSVAWACVGWTSHHLWKTLHGVWLSLSWQQSSKQALHRLMSISNRLGVILLITSSKEIGKGSSKLLVHTSLVHLMWSLCISAQKLKNFCSFLTGLSLEIFQFTIHVGFVLGNSFFLGWGVQPIVLAGEEKSLLRIFLSFLVLFREAGSVYDGVDGNNKQNGGNANSN